MQRIELAAALVAVLGFASGSAVIAAESSTDMSVSESQVQIAHAGAESACKGKDAACKGKDASCKGKDASCKGKEGSCKGKDSGPSVSKVGGAEMFSNKDIIDNAVNSPIHKTLVAAVKAADLVSTLKGPGPFTLFAPTDDAFKALPAGTVEGLLKPESKAALVGILTYHVVPGSISASDLIQLIKNGNGTAIVKTVQGEDLKASLKGKKVQLTDSKGNVATVTQADVKQSNGVIHVIDKVLMP